MPEVSARGGRCAGCGWANLSIRKVEKHTATCSDFAALVRTDPAKALDPRAEALRYAAAASRSVEEKEADRAEFTAAYREQAYARAAAARQRWRTGGYAPGVRVPTPDNGMIRMSDTTIGRVLGDG